MKKGLLFVLVIPVLIFIGLRRNSAPFFSVKEYRCVAPDVLSDTYVASIHSTLGQMLGGNLAAHELIDQLKKQFPVLHKIVISYRPSATHVMMSAHQPVCCINNSTILTTHNDIFPKDFFAAHCTEDVPKVTVLENMTNVPSFVSSLLHELPFDFDQVYNLELMNEHCVRLVDKQEPNFIIALTVDQKKSPLLLAQCESVKKNIAARAGFNKGVTWIADTRFAGYIVAYKA